MEYTKDTTTNDAKIGWSGPYLVTAEWVSEVTETTIKGEKDAIERLTATGKNRRDVSVPLYEQWRGVCSTKDRTPIGMRLAAAKASRRASVLPKGE